ncbi:unnamed protein product [Phaedon cochleariae]|uniref:Peptidase S1 domain-containing protein n=1 Tax=Phaedon cochleariae TaxID=80249 RepID=A0A9N9SLJ4_PHACE|nr:unnamed protein product [Phaedon cochleariae]
MDSRWWISFLLVFLIEANLHEWVSADGDAVPAQKGVIFDFLLNSLQSQSNTCKICKCGIPNRETRFLGGEYLTGHEFPWSALVYLHNNVSSPFPATLINDRYLVTAANNVIGLTPLDMKIGVGQYDICFPDVNSINVSVATIIINPEFSPGNRAHDIALLKLSTPITFTRTVQPICLAAQNARYLGQVATVSGWAEYANTTTNATTPTAGVNDTANANGTAAGTGVTAVRSCRPRKLGLPVLSYSECQQYAYDVRYVSPDKGCVGVVGSASPICEVDSGAAVMYRNYKGVYDIIGVLGDRNVCDSNPSLALYTTISDHLPWITQSTKDACYCYRS